MAEIRVVNHQTIDRDTDVIEERGKGSLSKKNGRHYIRYEVKTEDTASSVTVIAQDGIVRIKRAGAYGSEMIYDAKKRTRFLYRTPYGTMEMETDTIRIQNDLDSKGRLRIIYRLIMQGQITYNDTEIVVERIMEDK